MINIAPTKLSLPTYLTITLWPVASDMVDASVLMTVCHTIRLKQELFLLTNRLGLTLLGYPKMAHNFFGYRRRLVGNGAELMQNYYWAEFSNNFIHRYIGEAGEIIKCSGPCLLINNTVTETAGTFPGRSGKLSVIEGNYYLSMGLRGGGGYGKVIRNNYIENGALTAGSTEYPTVLGNVIDISHNTHINSRLHIVAWANDPRHQFNFTFNNNLLQNPTYTRETDNENEWKVR